MEPERIRFSPLVGTASKQLSRGIVFCFAKSAIENGSGLQPKKLGAGLEVEGDSSLGRLQLLNACLTDVTFRLAL